MLEVEHAENRQSAPEEAERIAEEVALLLDGGRFTDAPASERDLTLDDILVVAPYNAQVRCLRDRLPAAPGSAPSTSSRASRRRSSSSR